MAHKRRAGGMTGITVTFDEDMPVTIRKISSSETKQTTKPVGRFMSKVMLISSHSSYQWSLQPQQTLCSLVMIQICSYFSSTIPISIHINSSPNLSQR
ncbi:hypothetical protein MAR_006975 [Mya arenaria]|uniref:Uncharacterized protein n=1 Tax=Mya arenaria TaxID=6604 RepID=A0ABY7DDN4_MYAAR|nr:hypothetical protein MAR_006975 [Mya arenaria]